jgi:hypothetical protein
MGSSYGTPAFEAYVRNMRRLYWVDFVESQMQAARPSQFKASLVGPPLKDVDNLTTAFDYHRHRLASHSSGE